jgi:diguanylate cyclase (GGDEF)-like protein
MAGHRVRHTSPSAPSRPWADRAREVLAEPRIISGLFPAVATAALLLVLPVRHWSTPALMSLVGGTCMAALFAVVNLWPARRPEPTPWVLHLEIGAGNLGVTAVVAVAATEHVNLANLYLLTATVAVLLFSFRAALIHVGLAGIYYAALLAFDATTADAPVVAWLAVFGTIAVVGAVVMGLLSVLQMAATADPLTGLANRRAWDARVDEEMERSLRTGTVLTVVLVDLDGFKEVNDRDGHVAGDRLLQHLASAWQTQVRDGGDFLARIGGDEFALLALGTDQVGIRRLIKRLEEVTPPTVSFSAGEATWDKAERAPDLLRRADLAMYETKKLKRQRNHRPHSA